MGPRQRFIRNSHIAYNRTIHQYYLNAKFHFLGNCRYWLYPEEITTFFWFRIHLGQFLDFLRAITPVNNVSKTDLKFWLQIVLIVVQKLFKAFWKIRISTETGRTQSLSFWSNFNPSLSTEDGRNQKQPLDYLNQSKQKPYLISVFNEKYNYLLLFFAGCKWIQGQGSRGYILG